MIWLLLLGLALLAFGLFWFVSSLEGNYIGATFTIGAGLVMTLFGFGMAMIWLYDIVRKKGTNAG